MQRLRCRVVRNIDLASLSFSRITRRLRHWLHYNTEHGDSLAVVLTEAKLSQWHQFSWLWYKRCDAHMGNGIHDTIYGPGLGASHDWTGHTRSKYYRNNFHPRQEPPYQTDRPSLPLTSRSFVDTRSSCFCYGLLLACLDIPLCSSPSPTLPLRSIFPVARQPILLVSWTSEQPWVGHLLGSLATAFRGLIRQPCSPSSAASFVLHCGCQQPHSVWLSSLHSFAGQSLECSGCLVYPALSYALFTIMAHSRT